MTESVDTIYAERTARFGGLRDRAAARWGVVANLRLAATVLALGAAGLGWWRGLPGLFWLAAAFAAAFLALVAYHNRLGARRDRLAALFEQSREGQLRLRRDWAQLPLRVPPRPPARRPGPALAPGQDRTPLPEPEHGLSPATAYDLDLLGPASLQHLLNTARSPAGIATVETWLLQPAPPAGVRLRQAAVAELAPLLDLRDELAYLASRAGEAQGPYERFIAWSQGEAWLLRRPALLWLSRLSPMLLLAGLGAQIGGLTPLPLWGPFLALNILITALFGWRTLETLGQLYDRDELLRAYAALFRHAAGAPWQSEELRRISAELGEGPARADRRLGRLSLIAAAAELSRSLLYPALQFGLLWGFQIVALAESWRRRTGHRVAPWLTALGNLEALCALAALRHDHPRWQVPCVCEGEPPGIAARALGHPLLPDAGRVANDIAIGPPGSFVLITGSNMSGKSTLLRAIGVNVVLAQAGGPVCADELRLPPLALTTSMRVQDSLAQGVSYFMAELRRLKAIVDLAAAQTAGGPLVCFLLDEILHGTNSAERLVAASSVVQHLVGLGAIGAVSTHDLALAADPALSGAARLAHFSEHFVDGPAGPEMRFDYVLHPGLSTTTNALRLMALVGLPTGVSSEP